MRESREVFRWPQFGIVEIPRIISFDTKAAQPRFPFLARFGPFCFGSGLWLVIGLGWVYARIIRRTSMLYEYVHRT